MQVEPSASASQAASASLGGPAAARNAGAAPSIPVGTPIKDSSSEANENEQLRLLW